MDLTQLRQEIDGLDQELLALFLRRMQCSENVAAYKRRHGVAVFHPEREAEILRAMTAKAPPGMEPYVREFFEALLRISKERQQDLLESEE